MEKKKSAFSTALKWAIIFGLIGFIWNIIVYAAHLYLASWVPWVSVVLMIVGLVLVIKERRDKDQQGFITFGQAFGIGFLFCMLIAGIGIITNLLMTQLIAPDMLGEIQKNAEQKMIDKGMSDDQIQIAMKYTKMFMTPLWQAVWIVGATAFFGAIFSLIVAAIMRKDNPNLQAPTA